MKTALALALALIGSAQAATTGTHAAFVSAAKDQLTRSFKDPASAQYRGLFVSEVQYRGTKALCGEVNARNSYGGYVGFRRFVATDELHEVEDPQRPAVLADLWPTMCSAPLERVE